MASKYTFHFGSAGKTTTTEKIVQERRGGESDRHIVLKLLGFILYHDYNPRIEIPVSDNKRDYRPDVVAFDETGNIRLWVDCGQITLRKVDDLIRQLDGAALVVIKATYREMEGYALQAAKKALRVERVRFLGFDADYVPTLIAALGHNNSLAWTREGARLCLTLNGTDYVTTVWRWDAQNGCAIPDTGA